MLKQLKYQYYKTQTVDNLDLPKMSDEYHPFEDQKHTERIMRCDYYDHMLNINKITNDYNFLPTPKGLAIFKQCTVLMPCGNLFSEQKKLICPPNWHYRYYYHAFPVASVLDSVRHVEVDYSLPGYYFLFTFPNAYNYYHFTTDRLSTLDQFHRAKIIFPDLKLVLPPFLPMAYHELLYVSGIRRKDIIETQIRNYKFEYVIVPARNKDLKLECHLETPILKRLRNQALIYGDHCKAKKKIFITRKDADHRKSRLDNIIEVEKFLNQQGYESVTLTGLDLKQQIHLFQSASHIIGIHGAGLTNLIYANKDAKVIEFMQTDYMSPCYQVLSNALGIKHYILRCKKSDSDNLIIIEALHGLMQMKGF